MKQLSVTIPHAREALASLLKLLAEQRVDIRALSMGQSAAHPERRLVKLLVSDLEAATLALRGAGLTHELEAVLVVAIEDHPGGLHEIARVLAAAGVQIEHMYGFISRKEGTALDVLTLDRLDAGRAALEAAQVRIVTAPDERPVSPTTAVDFFEYFGGSFDADDVVPRE